MKTSLLVLMLLLITSCTTNLKTESWARDILNSEYVLVQDSVVVNINCTLFDKFTPTLGIQTQENFERKSIWTRAGCKPLVQTVLKAGEKITITDLYIRSDTIGSCWNVKARHQSNLEFFIPSCTFFHTDLWVKPEQPEVDGNSEIGFLPKYLLLMTD